MHAFGNETWGPLLIRVLARDRVPLFSLCFLLIAPYFPIGERDTPFVLYLWYVFICVVSGNGLFHSQSFSSSLWGIWLMRIAYGVFPFPMKCYNLYCNVGDLFFDCLILTSILTNSIAAKTWNKLINGWESCVASVPFAIRKISICFTSQENRLCFPQNKKGK